MGMCVMYSFCKYDPGPLRGTSSSDGSLMLRSINHRGTEDSDQHPALWKRTIPKGRRCKPLDFSGLILYDKHGNHLHQLTHLGDKPSSLDA